MFLNFSIFNEIILSLILGVVQGITEFLPISSTAHLLLIGKYLTKGSISLTASNVIQFGTFIAIVQYFWNDIKMLNKHILFRLKNLKSLKDYFINSRNWIKEPNQIFDSIAKQDIILSQLILASIPLLISALTLRKLVENLRDNLYYVAVFLTLGGILIVYSELMHIKKINLKKSKTMSFKEVLFVGFFQSLAVFPGISRSGSAMAGGLFLGRNREESVRFSFLLSLPALGLASIYDLVKISQDFKNGFVPILPSIDAWKSGHISLSIISIILAFIVAYIVGLVTLKFLLKYLAKNDSKIFVVYRIILTIFIIATYSLTL
jgi:undecaprenyl-diphosphatase